jgi:hypothetical protein
MAEVEQELTELSRRIVKIKRFTELSEPLEDDLPVEEAERIKAENDKAITEVSGLVIGTLEDPKIAELILARTTLYQGRRQATIHTIRNDQFYPPTGIYLTGLENSNYSVDLECSDHYTDEEKLKKRAEVYKGSSDNWEVVDKGDRGYVKISRKLTPTDLLSTSQHLFGSFIHGSNKLFDTAIDQIHSLTLAEKEAQRLESLTLACRGATQMITNARLAYLASAQ